jgi:hypothetical protein
MHYLRLAVLLPLLLGLSTPACEAQRARQRTPPRPAATRPATPPPAPVARPVKNIVLLVAEGYTDQQWAEARRESLQGVLTRDRLPYSGTALRTDGSETRDGFIRAIATGSTGSHRLGTPLPFTLLEVAKSNTKGVALVSGGSVNDPLAAALVTRETEGEVLQRIGAPRLDVLLSRSPLPVPGGGERDGTAAIMAASAAPLFAYAPAESVPFDTLMFRAMQLAGHNRNGYVVAATASPDTVSASELDAAIATVVDVARRNPGSLFVMVSPGSDPASAALHSFGQGAEKFSGTLAVSDVPKVIAGLANMRPFSRDYSPFFQGRTALLAPVAAPAPAAVTSTPGRPGPLPW